MFRRGRYEKQPLYILILYDYLDLEFAEELFAKRDCYKMAARDHSIPSSFHGSIHIAHQIVA